jgi:hypothetical protein
LDAVRARAPERPRDCAQSTVPGAVISPVIPDAIAGPVATIVPGTVVPGVVRTFPEDVSGVLPGGIRGARGVNRTRAGGAYPF